MTVRIPLASLRERLPASPRSVYWDPGVDDITGRALVQNIDAPIEVPLTLREPAEFRGQVRLLARDWRDGSAGVTAAIDAEHPGGPQLLWSAHLGSAAELGAADGFAVACTVPAGCTGLRMTVTREGPSDAHSVARALWIDPELTLADAPLPAVAGAARSPTVSVDGGARGPLISILTPVHDPPVAMLQAAVASVVAQSYANWELELVDDGSRRPEVIEALRHLADSDARIRLQRRPQAGGISAATNTALTHARGEFIGLLDHDDVFMPDALERLAALLEADPSIDMIYSDEALLYDDGRIQPIIKPGWSPEAMRALMYTCHLGIYRRALAEQAGGFDSDFDGCQDYDFVLRLMERTDRVAHIPSVLYHWRAHANSTAGGDQAKPYAYVSQPRAIEAHLERTGAGGAEVQFGANPGMHRIVYPVAATTQACLVLAAEHSDDLGAVARSWLLQPHDGWSVVLTCEEQLIGPARSELVAAGVPESRLNFVASDGRRGAAALAAAATIARGDVLVLMDAPAVGLSHDWLTRLISYASEPGIAAAGPVVLSLDDRILQSGVAFPDGLPVHVLFDLPAAAAPPAVANMTALDGVVATSAGWFERLGGLAGDAGALALIDYCLRADAADARSALVPDCRMQVSHPVITNDLGAALAVATRARGRGQVERFYNRAYRTDRADFSLR